MQDGYISFFILSAPRFIPAGGDGATTCLVLTAKHVSLKDQKQKLQKLSQIKLFFTRVQCELWRININETATTADVCYQPMKKVIKQVNVMY